MMHTSILEAIFSGQWAITEGALDAIIKIVAKEDYDKSIAYKAFHKEARVLGGSAQSINRASYQVGNKAIVELFGVITPRATMLETESGGAVSVETINQALDAIESNPSVKEVIFIHDSAGGNIVGINDLASRISSMSKPTTSFVYGMSASADYWLASASKRILASSTSEVGSLGVVATFRDSKEAEAKSGVKKFEIVSSASPFKRLDPSSDEGKAMVQDQVDKLAEIFLGTVAKNRNVSIETVKEKFGKGGMLVAKDALDVGMIDGITTLHALLNDSQNNLQAKATIVASTKNNGKKMDAEEIAKLDAEAISAHNPALAKELAGIGAKNAEARFKAIEALAHKTSSAEGKKIALEQRFNADATEGSVALLILEQEGKEREAEQARLEKIAEDKRALGETASKIQGSVETANPETEQKAKKEATVSNIIAGANATR